MPDNDEYEIIVKAEVEDDDIFIEERRDIGALRLPINRLTNYIKSQSNYKKFTKDASYLVTKSTEMFIENIVAEAYGHMVNDGKNGISLSHIASCLDRRKMNLKTKKLESRKRKKFAKCFTNEYNYHNCYVCEFCSHVMYHKKTLTNHIYAKHKEENKIKRNANKDIFCNYCDYKCNKESYLQSHIKRKHADDPSTWKLYKCKAAHCAFTCHSKDILRKHKLALHQQEGQICCYEKDCSFKTYKMYKLQRHLKEMHLFELHEENITFENIKEFSTWLENIERDDVCQFVIRSRNKATTYYVCNRSGNYVCRSSGRRRLKYKGSCKIDGLCAATIKRIERSDGRVNVHAQLTHFGHNKEIEHLRLMKSEKIKLKNKLLEGVPITKLYKEVAYKPIENDKVERINLVRRIDLHNLNKRLFKTDKTEHIADEYDNTMESVVEQLKADNKVYFHIIKTEGESEVHKRLGLTVDDFAIGFSTPEQLREFKYSGHNGLYVNTNEGIDYTLVTVSVLNTMNYCIPIAWCLCNRLDKTVWSIFFTGMATNLLKIGQVIPKPKFFMSAHNSAFYNGWVAATRQRPTKLICIMHVLRDWHKNLIMVKDYEMQIPIFKCMTSILLEASHDKALKAALEFQNSLMKDPVTNDFGEYFKTTWMSHGMFMQWSYCNRKGIGVQSNSYLEGFQNNFIKKFVRENLKNGRCLNVLLNYSLNEGQLKAENDEIHENQQSLCDKRHKKATQLASSYVKSTENCLSWIVEHHSKINDDIQTVNLISYACTQSMPCKVQCIKCTHICIHMYNCTCKDYLLNRLICKHLHLVNMCFPPIQEEIRQESKIEGGFYEQRCEEDGYFEETIVSDIIKPEIKTISETRQNFNSIKNYITTALDIVNGIPEQSIDEMDTEVLGEMKREIFDVVSMAKGLEKQQVQNTATQQSSTVLSINKIPVKQNYTYIDPMQKKRLFLTVKSPQFIQDHVDIHLDEF